MASSISEGSSRKEFMPPEERSSTVVDRFRVFCRLFFAETVTEARPPSEDRRASALLELVGELLALSQLPFFRVGLRLEADEAMLLLL